MNDGFAAAQLKATTGGFEEASAEVEGVGAEGGVEEAGADRGASQMEHLTASALSFLSIHSEHVHDPEEAASFMLGLAAPQLNPPVGLAGATGKVEEGAAEEEEGRGASQMEHFSAAASVFWSMHVEHVQVPEDVAAELRLGLAAAQLKPPVGLEGADVVDLDDVAKENPPMGAESADDDDEATVGKENPPALEVEGAEGLKSNPGRLLAGSAATF